ncbi:MAG TPA: hypothetical protein VII22_24415, partial [Streptosporangiaceae bacterium]
GVLALEENTKLVVRAATGTDPETAPGTTALATAGWTEPLTTTWSRRALLALLIPALILLIVVLV